MSLPLTSGALVPREDSRERDTHRRGRMTARDRKVCVSETLKAQTYAENKNDEQGEKHTERALSCCYPFLLSHILVIPRCCSSPGNCHLDVSMRGRWSEDVLFKRVRRNYRAVTESRPE